MANQLTAEIEARIQKFVADLNTLVRKAAIDSVAAALGGALSTNGSPRPLRGRRQGRRTVGAAPKVTPVAPSSAGRLRLPRLRKGQKRDPKDLERIVDAVRADVKAHPGEGVEHIAKRLGVATKEITLPIAKLLETKAIARKGVKRATRYFPT